MVYYILYFYLPALWFRRAWGEDTLNSRKPQKFAEPGLRMCLLIMLIFALVTFFFARFNRYIAYGEAVVTVLLAIYALIRARARQKELQAFVENVTYNAESATNNTLIHFPLPMAVFRLNDSGVVWGNPAVLGDVRPHRAPRSTRSSPHSCRNSTASGCSRAKTAWRIFSR